MNTKPLVSLVTLGCKLNQSETDSIAAELERRDFQVTQQIKAQAKYIVINTCTVTAKADRKSRNIISRALRNSPTSTLVQEVDDTSPLSPHPLTDPMSRSQINEKKKSIVIVTGCFVGSALKELEDMHIDYIIDNSKKKYIPDIVESHEQGQILEVDSLEADYFDYTPSNNIFHVRSNLKVQDGCDNFCTFCIIPMVRGKAQSRSLEDIVQDARTMSENGTKEIILTGVNMSRYVYDEYRFSDVIESLLKIPNDFRLRISSLEPDQLDEKFFSLMNHPRMCPHLHLCLQSGSDKILLKMRRMYNTTEFYQAITRIKKECPHINLTTDAIIGFPTETQEDFLATKHMIEKCSFSHTHIFPYSHRRDTRASRMEGEVSVQEKKERIKILEKINLAQKNTYRMSHLHSTHHVLVEKVETKDDVVIASGLSEYYVPVEITAPATSPQATSLLHCSNTVQPVMLTAHRTEARGEVIMQASI